MPALAAPGSVAVVAAVAVPPDLAMESAAEEEGPPGWEPAWAAVAVAPPSLELAWVAAAEGAPGWEPVWVAVAVAPPRDLEPALAAGPLSWAVAVAVALPRPMAPMPMRAAEAAARGKPRAVEAAAQRETLEVGSAARPKEVAVGPRESRQPSALVSQRAAVEAAALCSAAELALGTSQTHWGWPFQWASGGRAVSSAAAEHRMRPPGCREVVAGPSKAGAAEAEAHRQPLLRPGFLLKQERTSW
jgi:hypothetical protein